MKDIRIDPAAASELAAAEEWYATQRPGLGVEFHDTVMAHLRRLREGRTAGVPVLGVPRHLGAERILLRRFPYNIVFIVRGDVTWIVAVAHYKRRPGYWRARLADVPRP